MSDQWTVGPMDVGGPMDCRTNGLSVETMDCIHGSLEFIAAAIQPAAIQ